MMNIKRMSLITIILLISQTKIYASVEPTSGRYVDVFEDLSIQIIGGPLIWERVYRDRQWHFNHSWSSLIFEYDVISGEVKRIIRGKDSYTKLDSAGTLFKFGSRMRIRKNTDGSWTWQDRNGNRTEYAANGKALSTHKQSGSFITLMYNGDNKISGVKDVHHNQVLWIDYDLVTGQLDTVKDYGNREVKYTWEAIGSSNKYKLTKVTDALGYDWLYEYSSTPSKDGYVNLIKKTDPELRETHISYSGSGRVSSITNAMGHVTQYKFDYIKLRKEFYLKTQLPGGRIIESWFNRKGEIIRNDVNGINILSFSFDLMKKYEKDALGKIIIREYDEFGNIIKITYPDGATEKFIYDLTNSKIVSVINKNNSKINYFYDDQSNLISVVEAVDEVEERQIVMTYDNFGQLKSVANTGDLNTLISKEEYKYDDYGNVNIIIDAENTETKYSHNSQGNVIEHIDGKENVWKHTYNNLGLVTKKVTPGLNDYKFFYNKTGALIKINYPDGSNYEYEVDALDRVIKTKDQLGYESKIKYTEIGQIVSVTDEEGEESKYVYDQIGRLSSVHLVEGAQISYTYPDLENDVINENNQGNIFKPNKITYPAKTEKFDYDLQGRVIKKSVTYNQNGSEEEIVEKIKYDNLGNVLEIITNPDSKESFVYDSLNRKVKRYLNGVLQNQYKYDNRNNLIEFSDGNLQTHKFEYDLNDNQVKIIRPNGEFHQLIYDKNQNLKFRIDALGNKIENIFDDDNRLVGIKSYDLSQTLKKEVVFELNEMGSIKSYSDGIITGSVNFDLKQNKLSETVHIHNKTMSHSYTYFKNGKTKSFTGVDGVTYSYFYEGDKLGNIVIPNIGNITYSSDFQQNSKDITYPGGMSKSLILNGVDKVSEIKVKDSNGNWLQNNVIEYGDNGLTASISTMQGMHQFSYDSLNRLNYATHPTINVENYEYDHANNRIKSDETDEEVWVYNLNNQLLDSKTHKYSYDANGNLIRRSMQDDTTLNSYEYNEEMRLSKVLDDQDNLIFEYYYDPFGRRVFKKNIAENKYTYFHYSKQGLIFENRNNEILVNYLLSPYKLDKSEPILKKVNGDMFYYLNNHLGAPQKIVDVDGNIKLDREFSAFGKIKNIYVSDEHIESIALPGQYIDSESFTYHNYFRDYSPDLGRYIQRDPLGVIPAANEYAYVESAPLDYKDPYGLAGLGLGICTGIACLELELEFSFTCITASVCVSLGAGGPEIPPITTGSGSASAGGLSAGRSGGSNEYEYETPKPEPDNSCFSWSAGCQIQIGNFSAGGGVGSGGAFPSAGYTPDDWETPSLGCEIKGCVQVYSSCNKCLGFNGCGY